MIIGMIGEINWLLNMFWIAMSVDTAITSWCNWSVDRQVIVSV
ncbi:MAG: hypothetical protein CLLPBCKN_001692 [Chroococcidiopsis cubana SAG 39.79]|nr:hypothetical protein [Chroococcidiopsis cubana SAG 39.79]